MAAMNMRRPPTRSAAAWRPPTRSAAAAAAAAAAPATARALPANRSRATASSCADDLSVCTARCGADALNRASKFTSTAPAAPAAAPPTAAPAYVPPVAYGTAVSSVDTAFRDRLLAINTPALADANKEGLRVMDHQLRPLNSAPVRFAGVARTVRCFNDFLTVRALLSAPTAVIVFSASIRSD